MFLPNDTQMDDTVMTARTPDAPLPNSEFAPPRDRLPARWSFDGVLAIEGGELSASDGRVQGHAELGGRPDRFPRVDLAFVTDGEALVPLHCGLHRKPDPESYWDIMAGQGCVWSTQGGDGRDRACFPFQLSCERENDSHHGLARFSWDGRRVTDLVVQVVTETLPDHLPERLDLWGGLKAAFRGPGRPARPARRHDPWPLHRIEELEDRVPRHLMEALLKNPFRESEIVSGLAMKGRIYTTGIRTRHGPWPFPHAMRFGIWSATKAAFGTTALMRLACHLGPDVAETRIADVLDVTARHDGWSDVTIRNCLDMATGIGTAGRDPEPVDIYADNLTQPDFASAGGEETESYHAYQRWYAARSLGDKLGEALSCPSYPWKPGMFARYRDQDLFMAGAAMDALWKRYRGEHANLFSMVADDVFRPIGMAPVDMNRTLEPGGGRGVPLTAFGLFLGLDDAARLGRLLSDLGCHEGEQLLDRSLAQGCLGGEWAKGLPTGTFTAEGREVTYHLAYWQLPMTTRAGRDVRIPTMRGYGGQIIQPLWNGITCFRFGHDSPMNEQRYDALMLPRLADALRPL